ncbi:putative ribonuclease h protein [Quercus suber]|uniref:Ribonuclease h protein n=1 Tax=Quercus suber TaxID=58331 RepID=A0AAW0M6J1_QUESU
MVWRDINVGATETDSRGSEESRRHFSAGDLGRRVDQGNLFQERPNLEEVIMTGTEILDVNGSVEANRVTVSTDLEASFQAQLEEIDTELNKFETLVGREEVGPVSVNTVGAVGPGLMGQRGTNGGLFESNNDQVNFESAKGRRWAQESIKIGSSGMKKEPSVLKRNLRHLHCHTSDHRPILLSLNGNGEKQRWKRKLFRFESMWVADPGCKAAINEAWAEPVWNSNIIETMFYPWEASMITGTIVSKGEDLDTLVWPLTSDGEYLVQTAYWLLKNGVAQANPSSSTDTDATVWKGVWKIHAPSKIRHFMWRVLKDSLPTKLNLRTRQVMVDEACSLCEDGKETIMHSLWYCEQAQAVWKAERSFVDLYKKQHRSLLDLFETVIQEGSTYRIAWFATIAWSLWQRRNRI